MRLIKRKINIINIINRDKSKKEMHILNDVNIEIYHYFVYIYDKMNGHLHMLVEGGC